MSALVIGDTPDAIARAIAEIENPFGGDSWVYVDRCRFCGEASVVDVHEVDCPWLRARAFVTKEPRP